MSQAQLADGVPIIQTGAGGEENWLGTDLSPQELTAEWDELHSGPWPPQGLEEEYAGWPLGFVFPLKTPDPASTGISLGVPLPHHEDFQS